MRFHVAVTTAPRKVEYLPQTLDSLTDAGFRNIAVVRDTEDAGPWPTFKKALRSLLNYAKPEDWLVVFQDDVRVSRGLSGWLTEHVPCDREWDDVACVSLYCAGPNHQTDYAGWHQYNLTDRRWVKAYGACGLMMPADSAQLMLDDNPRPENRSKTDMNVAEWCAGRGLSYLFHSPSLVQHIGAQSTLHSVGLTKHRKASHFVEDVAELEAARA